MNYPPIVSRKDWQAARAQLLAEEKAATRMLDALAARRREQPMTEVTADYVFTGQDGRPKSLVDLFSGHEQLIVYHHMLEPESSHVCPGCAQFSDNMGHTGHLQARRTAFCMVSRARPAEIARVKARFGWQFDWVSCFGSRFHEDFVEAQGASFGLSVFMRQEARVFQSYFTTGRGVEHTSNTFGLLDATPWGRQETWERSPPGFPQEPAHSWRRLRDRY